MPTSTYIPLATTTLASATSSITFGSIPSYRDYIVVIHAVNVSAGGRTRLRLNSDTGSNYTRVRMYNSGNTPTSNSATNSFIEVGYQDSGADFMEIHQFLDGGAIDKHKTVLSRSDVVEGTDLVAAAAHRWANTSAINEIEVYRDAGNFGVSTSVSLFGIEA